MKYNFEDFVNLKEHKDNLRSEVQDAKSAHSRNGASEKKYLDAISNMFLEDIRTVASNAYENACVEMRKDGIKLKTELSTLRICIQEGVIKNIFPEYENHLSSYNIGGVIIDYAGNIHEYKKTFIEKSNEKLKKQCDLLHHKYLNDLNKDESMLGVFFYSKIAAVAAVITAIPVVYHVLKILLQFIQKALQ